MYAALEAVIATEAGNAQLQSGVWQTLRNITGQTLSSRTLRGRFLFEEIELLQVLMERLGPGSAFCSAVMALAEHMPSLLDIRRRVTTRHLRQSWLTVVVKLYPLEPFPT
jgi:hypothetical protein